MAVFNPQVQPTQDPNYMNYAKVTEAPPPNQAGRIGLETAGAALDGIVSTLDTSIKRGIADTANTEVDKIRDQFTQGLETLKSSLDKGIIPAPAQTVSGSTVSPKTVLDAAPSSEDLPPGLDTGLDRIAALAQAKAAGSPKLNDTQYAKDTLSVAKQLRAQFPGYRDYIDQEVSKASGLPVANSYYQNMLQDINRQLTQIGKSKDEMGSTMMKNLDVPNMGVFITMRNNKDPRYPGDATMLEKISDWQNLQSQLKIDAAKRAEAGDNKVKLADMAESSLTKNMNSFVAQHVNGIIQVSGMESAGALIKYINDVSTGNIKASDAEVDQRVAQLSAIRNVIYQQAKTMAADVEPIIGSDKSEGIIKRAMSPIDTILNFAKDKDSSPAFFHARQNTAIQADSAHNFMINHDTQKETQQLYGARFWLGDQYFPTFMQKILGASVDAKYAGMLSQEAMSAIQPYKDSRGEEVPRYLVDAVKHAKGIPQPPGPEYYGKVIDLVSSIADPNMPLQAKDKMINWAFNQKNVKVLDELKMEYRDPSTGEIVPGKYRAFNILSAPAITNAVAETAKLNPENYVKFQSTLEQEFGNLYKEDVNTLNKMVSDKSFLGDAQLHGKIHFAWNEENNSFSLVDDKDRVIRRSQNTLNPHNVYMNGILDVLDRVNGGIKNLSYVQEHSPTGSHDTSQYILQTLQTIGFRPGENISGATTGMMKSVIKSRAPELTNEQLDKMILGSPGGVTPQKMNFGPESNSGDLSSFLANPTGGMSRARQNNLQPKAMNSQNSIPKPHGNYMSEGDITGVDVQDIPENMSAREFIQSLRNK